MQVLKSFEESKSCENSAVILSDPENSVMHSEASERCSCILLYGWVVSKTKTLYCLLFINVDCPASILAEEGEVLGGGRVSNTWYPISNSSRPIVFWTVQILEREKKERE